MDTVTLILAGCCLCMLVATALAWRQDNEGRDIGLLGAMAGLFGAGSLATLAL